MCTEKRGMPDEMGLQLGSVLITIGVGDDDDGEGVVPDMLISPELDS
jgi:hypothetical protein